MENIRCTVERITYQNEENGWSVLRVNVKGYKDVVTLVGNFCDTKVGAVLAYATTIHKSQGSEYPIVIIPVFYSFFTLLQRNLIYTAITRAKKICVLIGQMKALGYAVKNLTVEQRNTKLKERLRTNE